MGAETLHRFRLVPEETAELHRRTLDHPTVNGIGNGNLPEEIFRYYLEQDYQFLLRFVRVLAVAASSAPDLDSMAQLSRLVSLRLTSKSMPCRRCMRVSVEIPSPG